MEWAERAIRLRTGGDLPRSRGTRPAPSAQRGGPLARRRAVGHRRTRIGERGGRLSPGGLRDPGNRRSGRGRLPATGDDLRFRYPPPRGPRSGRPCGTGHGPGLCPVGRRQATAVGVGSPGVGRRQGRPRRRRSPLERGNGRMSGRHDATGVAAASRASGVGRLAHRRRAEAIAQLRSPGATKATRRCGPGTCKESRWRRFVSAARGPWPRRTSRPTATTS